ncbi:Galactose-1-phosphate uridylyltransferase [Polystyrenella longa]|uniref:Galactose-1-phosphate uridylyltransferase n=1 Tax=Polystyrenella longa TaxID=2528007 RepID=A0A518CI09_9PLAN|nr:galactose-1-phosphate uridylyltransferase [Polystyrenella longa]QDU78851.1 Galactose-1-phosphate uridylyltransferase [Polystyrenella longa]
MMPEMRRNPLTGEWTLYAPDRVGRPSSYQSRSQPASGGFNPFVEGNESTTTEEVLAVREPGSAPDGPGWQARIILNKYPVVTPLTEDVENEQRAEGSSPFFESRPVLGHHDVIVESPQLVTRFHELPVEQVRQVFGLYHVRWQQLSVDRQIQYAILFKNEGPAAGASLEHVHSQCLGLPFVPDAIERQLKSADDYLETHGRNFFDDYLAEELSQETRIVAETEQFVTVCPFFSRFPFETWIVPRRQSSRFEEATAIEVEELADQVHQVLNQLQQVREGIPYNFILQSAPFGRACDESFRWHFQITPRLSQLAGLELGSGQMVNLVLPEEASRLLKSA